LAKQLEIKDAVGGCSPNTFLKHYNNIRNLKFRQDQAVALTRVAKKQAKSDGVNLDALAIMERMANLPLDEAKLLLNQFGIYSTLTKQEYADLPLFAASNSMTPSDKTLALQVLEDAEHAGRLVGCGGGNKNDNPHRVGTELFVRWADGFNNGWEFFEKRPTVEKKEKTASTGKKGRPPSKANDRAKAATTAAPSAVQ